MVFLQREKMKKEILVRSTWRGEENGAGFGLKSEVHFLGFAFFGFPLKFLKFRYDPSGRTGLT